MILLKKYKFFLITILVMGIIFLINKDIAVKAISVTSYSLKEMIFVIPPIFMLLGLLDVWVPKETMIKFMGENSGIKGILLSILIGSAAAGPLYGAFPVAAIFMKKGVKFSNVLIFIGAWSTTKIPMFLFEMSALGLKFAFTRLFVDIPGIILISYILSASIDELEVMKIYENAESM